jgi:microcystin-dependent protein
MALKDEIQNMKTIEQGVANNKVVNFAYTNKAYTDNDVNGVDVYDYNNENNIPTNNPDVIKVNPTVITKGYRAQASSITRMLVNHIFGRVSYNLNKTTDLFTSLLDKLGNAIGEPNGIATLDADGRIPFSQLPETAVEYKGEWNAETNTPTLADGIGTKGDMYYVSTDGTQNLGSGAIVFLAGDRIIYNGSIWQKLSGGSVKKVNNVRPDDTGNVTLTGEQIKASSILESSLTDLLFPAGRIEHLAFIPDVNWLNNNKRLICDGSAVSRTEYPRLFNAIGTTFGVGDGSTTFNLPNYIGKMLFGSKTTVTETGGSQNVTLTENELPSHSHTMNHTHTGAKTSGTNVAVKDDNSSNGLTLGGVIKASLGQPSVTIPAYSGSTGNKGSGNAFSVMNPYNTAVPVITY